MSNFDGALNYLNHDQLQVEIIKLRNVIRYHRDQKGDERSWLDDELLYEALPEHVNRGPNLPNKEEFMHKCTRFHARRQAPHKIENTQAQAESYFDDDIRKMTIDEQKKEITRLRHAIRLHRNMGDLQRTWQDDQRLYAILNENTEYDTTLPDLEEFLASCSRFFSNHGNTAKLNNR